MVHMIELVRQGKVDFPHMIVSVSKRLNLFIWFIQTTLQKAIKKGIHSKEKKKTEESNRYSNYCWAALCEGFYV